MFKVSDDLEFDEDFLDSDFSEDFSTVPKTEKEAEQGAPGTLFNGPRREGVETSTKPVIRRPVDNENQSLSPGDHGAGTTQLRTGFVPKYKTSPVLSSNFGNSLPKSNGNIQQEASRDDRVLPSRSTTNVSLNGAMAPGPPMKSASTSSSVQSKNLDFLASWNDDDFFNPPAKSGTPLSTKRTPHSVTPVVTRQVNKTVRQRRFPGPAGLLPPRQGNTSLIAPEEFLNELKSDENDPTLEESEILSQNSGSIFEGGAWSAMLDDLGLQGPPLLRSMNLASIKSIGRNLRSYKVPFLAVLVQSIDASLPDAAVVFKDPTGEMHGVVHRDVWDQFNTDIAIGTVLVLRNVGIISAGMSTRKHVINITGNNLTAIYSPKDELNVQLRQIHALAASDSPELLAEWSKIESRTASSSPLTTRIQQPPSFAGVFSTHQNLGSRSSANSPANKTLSQPHSTLSPNFALRKPMTPNSSPFSRMPSRHQPKAAKENSPIPVPNLRPPSASFAVKAPSRASPFGSTSHQSNKDQPTISSQVSSNQYPSKKTKINSSANFAPKVATNSDKPNPFQVDADTSVIDCLLDGIDTDSLFGDF